jgi:hypothetical protein
MVVEMEAERWRRDLLATERHSDPRRLTHHGWKAYSQADEDGMLAEILRRVGAEGRTFVEFGVGGGRECNTVWLLLQGWTGGWIEASSGAVQNILRTHAAWINAGSLRLAHSFVTVENIERLISKISLQQPVDFLSVDIDGNDYWVWRAITNIQPRVVVMEYNATWRPPVSLTLPYDPSRIWNGVDNYYGASLSALTELGESKGYKLVGCSLSGVNAFFVREDLVGDRFLNPGSAEEHYEPARYPLCLIPAGAPPELGALVRPSPSRS